jgi:hypothetical protein
MERDQLSSLLSRLIEATRSGKFRWETTADEATFRLVLDTGIIHVEQIVGPERYVLWFLNQNNAVVDSYKADNVISAMKVDMQVRDLFEAARSSALKPDEFFLRLEQEVNRRSG